MPHAHFYVNIVPAMKASYNSLQSMASCRTGGMVDMAQEGFSGYDTADYLKTEEDIAAYLEAVMEDGDPVLVAAALADIAHARCRSRIRCSPDRPSDQ